MNREQIAHVLRAASRVVEDPEILVIGSQSLLASYGADELPLEATASMEVDLAYFDDPDESKADAVDGAIGELSLFHQTFGFYAQGVSVRTAVLPVGWQDRVVRWSNNSTGAANAAFLEPHDCAVSKLVAYREKDRAFAAALLKAGLIDDATLHERINELPEVLDPRLRRALHDWVDAQ
jgi:Nucleotidyltransferase of unknown function (DUF6036)